MATVYQARDIRHKRPVALMVVRPELGRREGVERFLREVELAARLQHPHILPVFDSGFFDGGRGHPADSHPLFIPLTNLAHGRTYEAAGKPDSAALAYGTFIRLWDAADPGVAVAGNRSTRSASGDHSRASRCAVSM